MPNKPQTPAQAFKNFFENISISSILWIIIASFVGYVVFLIARRQYRKNSYTIIDLATWFTITLFTAIVTYSYFGYYIGNGESWGWYFLCFFISFFAVYAANRELHKYQRLITTLIVIIIGGCLFWSFIAGEQGIMFAIMFGVLQGGSFQLFLTTLIRYIQSLNSTTNKKTEENEKWNAKKKI